MTDHEQTFTPNGSSWSKGVSLAFILVVYIAAVAVGWLFVQLTEWTNPLWIAAGADIAGTLTVFVAASFMRNTSVYDPYWSLAPIPLGIYWMSIASPGANSARQWLVITLVTLWGIRLTYNWVRGWPGMKHEDWRYTAYRHRAGRLYVLIDLFGLQLFPTIQVFLGLIPAYYAIAQPSGSLGVIDILAVLITASAILIEAVADEQLRAFIRERSPGDIMNNGLWKYSRHPNYFGQIMLWWGIYLFALAVDTTYWWTGVGALSITIMFIVVSVPLLDERSRQRRPGYDEHCEKVSAIIPMPPRQSS